MLKIKEIQIIEVNKGQVLARADVCFEGFVLKGFKILRDKELTGKEYVTPPSYKSPKGWRPLFKTDSKDEWNKICSAILKKYEEFLINKALEGVEYENKDRTDK